MDNPVTKPKTGFPSNNIEPNATIIPIITPLQKPTATSFNMIQVAFSLLISPNESQPGNPTLDRFSNR